jgi:ABC-type transporter Mla MlaB component
VEEIDTAGFACVINFIKENLREGKRIGIINVRKKDKDLAEMLKLGGAVKLFAAEEEAMKELKCQK